MKRKRKMKILDDRLSSLPEDILTHILSLMPTKFVVGTSILSKRWRYTWMLVTDLNFQDFHQNQKTTVDVVSFTKFVDWVLKFYKHSHVNKFRLHIHLLSSDVQNSSLSKWIDEAVRLNVHELDIHAKMNGLPLSMFTCKTLTKLRLNDVSQYWKCESYVYLPCLKSLEIVADYNIYPENAFRLISGCPVLERLSISVPFTFNVKKYIPNTLIEKKHIFDIPTLKHLKLVWSRRREPHINKVVLRAPSLEYLFVGGDLYSLFEMEDVPSLVQASFSFYENSFNDCWVELLKGISGVKSLTLSVQSVSSRIDLNIPFALSLPIYPNLEQLEFNGIWHPEPIFQFLESSPELKHLYVDKLQDSCWIEWKWVPASTLTNLTTMKLSNCNQQESNIAFLEYMLENSEALKTVTIDWENSRIGKVKKRLFAQRLMILPRASSLCEIHFHGLILPAAN